MSEEAQDQDRLDRDRERSAEAHWRAAEAGAEDAETQKTPQGLEIPVPAREDGEDDLRKLIQPEKKS